MHVKLVMSSGSWGTNEIEWRNAPVIVSACVNDHHDNCDSSDHHQIFFPHDNHHLAVDSPFSNFFLSLQPGNICWGVRPEIEKSKVQPEQSLAIFYF